MIATKTFRYELADGVATLTLDRPDSLNSLTFDVYAELRDTLRALEHEDDVHAVVLTGAGRGFCSGGSVDDIIGPLFAMSPPERLVFTRMTGAMGAAWLLPQVVGLARATEILMLGEPIVAAEALRIGLTNRVVAMEQVLPEARALALKLARGPRFALGMTKEMLNREPGMSLEEALEAEAQAQQICMATRDFREAYEAFVAKREPRFEGR